MGGRQGGFVTSVVVTLHLVLNQKGAFVTKTKNNKIIKESFKVKDKEDFPELVFCPSLDE